MANEHQSRITTEELKIIEDCDAHWYGVKNMIRHLPLEKRIEALGRKHRDLEHFQKDDLQDISDHAGLIDDEYFLFHLHLDSC